MKQGFPDEPDPTLVARRRRREKIVVICVFCLVIFFGFLEGWFFKLQANLPLSGNLFLFALINLNVILLLLLAYLVLRNIAKLIFERKRNILGHKLKTQLVIAFVGLTLIPTIPLFYLATQFIFSSLDYWFSHRVEYALEQSVSLAKNYLEQQKADLRLDGETLRAELLGFGDIRNLPETNPEISAIDFLNRHQVDALFFMNSERRIVWRFVKPGNPPIKSRAVKSVEWKENDTVPKLVTISSRTRDEALVVHGFIPSADEADPGIQGQFLAFRRLPLRITDRLSAITTGYDDYLQLKLLHKPLKRSHFITFSIVTLLTMFAAVWFAFFLAKRITVPIQALAMATQSIAEGNLEVQLRPERDDEIGVLITHFNEMVRDLREGREQLGSAYAALKQSNTELEDRRLYMEIVLANIAAGVVSLDATGHIMTINKSAEAIFGLHSEAVRGLHYSELLEPQHREVVDGFIGAYQKGHQPYIERQVNVLIGKRPMVLLIKATILRDDLEAMIGVVVVFDDLTDLEKAQRMAAWREVAKRIAHEIKNPLTPIKLCAQRIQRRFTTRDDTDGEMVDECTRTIVQQVDHMKHLVNEFSRFARLPRAQLAPNDLGQLVDETVNLYRHTHPDVQFETVRESDPPLLRLDPEQFKQVLMNILDNAVHALAPGEGRIRVTITYDADLKIARLECADNGHGVSPDGKLRMFEPYYSTKEKGTGLGLAIVSTIVADHNGFIRVRDNTPGGTVIVIELPG